MSFLQGPSYLAQPRETGTWIIDDLLPVNGLLNIYGRPKSGKSFLALQFANAIANPTIPTVLGFPLSLHGKVAYLQVDTSRPTWIERLENLERFGHCHPDVYYADALMAPYPFDIMRESYGWLASSMKQIAPYPIAVIIDTLREVHSGDENDSGHMKNVISLLVGACAPAAIITLTHSRKENGDSSDLMDDIRGSSYIPGRMDCIIKVTDTSLHYQSRAVSQQRLQVSRDAETGIFLLNDEFERAARDVVKSAPGLSTMEKARMLNDLYKKKSLEACRSMIRRLEPKLSPRPANRSISVE